MNIKYALEESGSHTRLDDIQISPHRRSGARHKPCLKAPVLALAKWVSVPSSFVSFFRPPGESCGEKEERVATCVVLAKKSGKAQLWL